MRAQFMCEGGTLGPLGGCVEPNLFEIIKHQRFRMHVPLAKQTLTLRNHHASKVARVHHRENGARALWWIRRAKPQL